MEDSPAPPCGMRYAPSDRGKWWTKWLRPTPEFNRKPFHTADPAHPSHVLRSSRGLGWRCQSPPAWVAFTAALGGSRCGSAAGHSPLALTNHGTPARRAYSLSLWHNIQRLHPHLCIGAHVSPTCGPLGDCAHVLARVPVRLLLCLHSLGIMRVPLAPSELQAPKPVLRRLPPRRRQS